MAVAADAEKRGAARAAAPPRRRRQLRIDGPRAVVERGHDGRADRRHPRHPVDVELVGGVARPVIVVVAPGVEEEDGRAGGVEARVVGGRKGRATQVGVHAGGARGVGGGGAQPVAGVDAADRQRAVAHTPDHVEVQHGRRLPEWQRGVAHVVAGADQPDLLGAEEHEHECAARAAGGGEGAGEADDDGRARRVVVGAVVGGAARGAEMIPVGAEHDRLAGEHGIGAGQHADDVGRAKVRGRQVDGEARRRPGRRRAQRLGRRARERAGRDVHRRGRRVERGEWIGDEQQRGGAALAGENQRLESRAARCRDDDLVPQIAAPIVVGEGERPRHLAAPRAAVRRPVDAGLHGVATHLERAARAETAARRQGERL